MTLHATREGQRITIHGNTGVSLDVALGTSHPCPHLVMDNGYAQYARITEDAQHVRYFWHQLGEHLNAADAEREQPADADNEIPA
jgi:hypothetical protein